MTAAMGRASADDVAPLLRGIERVVDRALDHARGVTDGGKRIDDHQVHCERIAYATTELHAARALATYAEASADHDPIAADVAAVFAAQVAARLRAEASAHLDAFGFDDDFLADTLDSPELRRAIRAAGAESRVLEIGRRVLAAGGTVGSWLDGDLERMTRDSVRQFARTVVEPLAQRIHMHDELVPDDLIRQMSELGYFGMSVPEEYGGGGMGNLAMILTTEELSAASLAAAGSLITRPEILTKALLKGGTEEQKRAWLPRVAAGEVMVAISVTEPDTGSDVASVKCRAERGTVNGEAGWVVNGAKAWCTFAGRANVIALLARTDPTPASGARGLSLFIVEKDAFPGHEFEMKQPAGGSLHGKADATPGYRGMHSYTLNFDNYFVPAANLVGEDAGEGKGFYLQMAGFAAGRLQTGGRACGVAQAALEKASAYVTERKQFGQPIAEFQLTQWKLGRMATDIAAARQLTYAAARAMDQEESATLDAAMAKLFASDVAQRVTQEGQLLHGGWGFAEEFPICRYVLDSLVLPIFEGVKPILELKVIARALLAR
ncbi:MAG: (2S)-methylsuccinyl-CoA dehydrogenase [Candidatus Binatota bacterium]|jgi:(2S)-methylsuccinyl-CoA dehydrogenase|nr:(2S)-methylsuccinyl-CoA dehydrogenase [Candidatus Binatota bacterium]